MKNLITYILLSLTILVTLGTTAVYAQSNTSEREATDITDEEFEQALKEVKQEIEQENEYKPTIIPKPDYIPGPDITEVKTERKTLITNFLPRLTISLIGLAGAAALIVILISGVRMSLHFGNEDTINKAKDHIIYAIIGLIIAMLSYTIVKITVNLDFEKIKTTQEQTSSTGAFSTAATSGAKAGTPATQ